MEALRQSKPVTLFDDEWRTPVYADDIAEVVARIVRIWAGPRSGKREKIFAPGHSLTSRIFHVPGAERITRYEFGKRLLAHMGGSESLLIPCNLSDQATEAHRPSDVSLCADKIRRLLGFSPTPIGEGIARTFEKG